MHVYACVFIENISLYLQYMDIGDDIGIPEEFTKGEMVSGIWWRHLVSGSIAGTVSRTCTAPLDRVKVYLQVSFYKSLSQNLCYMNSFGSTVFSLVF